MNKPIIAPKARNIACLTKQTNASTGKHSYRIGNKRVSKKEYDSLLALACEVSEPYKYQSKTHDGYIVWVKL